MVALTLFHHLTDTTGRLAEGEGQLTTLAQALGFCEHGHLTRAFRRAFGHTPSAVRGELQARARH